MSQIFFHQLSKDSTFDIIVSNPPYITDKEFARLDPSVKNWEDARALLAEDDGLALIAQIIETAPLFLQSNEALKAHVVPEVTIEIGWQQGPAVQQLMQKADYRDVQILKDTGRKDRTVSGRVIDVAATDNKK